MPKQVPVTRQLMTEREGRRPAAVRLAETGREPETGQ